MKVLDEIFPAGFPPSREEPILARATTLRTLLSWADLERVLATSCFQGAGSEAIRQALDLPDPGWSRVCVLTNGESIWRAPRQCDPAELRRRLAGATLRVEALEEVHPPVTELAAELSRMAPAVYVNAYAAWGGSPGLAIHYDYTDVLVLQLRGRKHWRIYRPTRPAVRGPESRAYKDGIQAAARGEPNGSHEELRRVRAGLFWEGELEPGQALYLPPGWFHEVNPVGAPTLHLSCAFSAPGAPMSTQWAYRLPDALRAR